MKCQKCTKAATLHITEVVSDEQFEELHLCEECAHKYLYEPQQKGLGAKEGEGGKIEESVEAYRSDREVWSWVLYGALIVLAIEWLIYLRRALGP